MSERQLSVFQSGIRDNRERGTVGEFLKEKIQSGSKLFLSLALIFFIIDTIAYAVPNVQLSQQLDSFIGRYGLAYCQRTEQVMQLASRENWSRERLLTTVKTIAEETFLETKEEMGISFFTKEEINFIMITVGAKAQVWERNATLTCEEAFR